MLIGLRSSRRIMKHPPPLPSNNIKPAWRTAMTARTWAEIPTSNSLHALDPALDASLNLNGVGSAAPWKGSDGFPGIVDAWSGAVYDKATDTMVLWGGGHGNYYGNEAYKLRIDQEAPTWIRLYAPSGAGIEGVTSAYYSQTSPAPFSNGTHGDGKPRSQHTYDKIVYVNGYLWNVRNSGGSPDGALGDNYTWRMDVSTGEWEQVALFGSVAGRVAVAYDSSRNRLYSFQDDDDRVGYLSLDNTAAGWTFNANPAGVFPPNDNWYLSAEYMPEYDLFIVVAGRQTSTIASSVLFYDPTNDTYYQPSLTGTDVTDTILNFGYCHPAYVPGDGVYLWDNIANRANLVKLTLGANPRTDACVKSIVTPDASNAITPTARAGEGTYGRFQYSSRLDGFFLVNGVRHTVNSQVVAEPTYFFALS